MSDEGISIGDLQDVMRTAERYRRGNTQLLESLMDMVNQHFRGHPTIEGVLMHNHVSADEDAIATLIEAGMAREVDGGYILLWQDLEKRKPPHRQTWAEAVNGLRDVSDEEKALLLALDHGA